MPRSRPPTLLTRARAHTRTHAHTPPVCAGARPRLPARGQRLLAPCCLPLPRPSLAAPAKGACAAADERPRHISTRVCPRGGGQPGQARQRRSRRLPPPQPHPPARGDQGRGPPRPRPDHPGHEYRFFPEFFNFFPTKGARPPLRDTLPRPRRAVRGGSRRTSGGSTHADIARPITGPARARSLLPRALPGRRGLTGRETRPPPSPFAKWARKEAAMPRLGLARCPCSRMGDCERTRPFPCPERSTGGREIGDLPPCLLPSPRLKLQRVHSCP